MEREISSAELQFVNTKTQFWQNKESENRLIDDVMAGDKKILNDRYIVKYDKESAAKYEKRLASAIEKPIAKEMVRNFVDKCTRQAITIDTNDEWLKSKEDNFDGRGTTIHEFVRKLLYTAEPFSEGHIMVENRTNMTINDDPVVNILDLKNILHHRINDDKLTYFRFREYEIIERQFEDALRTVVKEFYLEDGKLKYNQYQDNADANFGMVLSEIEINFDEMPLIEFYPNGSIDRFCVDLQWKSLCRNQIQHANYYSQYLNLSKNTSFSFLFAKKLGKAAEQLELSSDTMVHSDEEGAEISWVVSDGQNLAGTLKTVEKIETDMQNNALNVNVNKQSITATQSIIDESTINSILTNQAMSLKSCMIKIINMIIKVKFGADKKIPYTLSLSTDFTTKLEQISLQHLNDLHDRGLISDKTRFNESKKEGYLDENLTFETEVEQIKKEALDKIATDTSLNYFDEENNQVVVRDEMGKIIIDDQQNS